MPVEEAPQRDDWTHLVVTMAEGRQWQEAIDQAVARGRYFFSVTQFVVWGIAGSDSYMAP